MNFAFGFDIAAGCLLAFFAVRGAFRGFSGEIIALIGLAASVFCGWTFAQPADRRLLGGRGRAVPRAWGLRQRFGPGHGVGSDAGGGDGPLQPGPH